MYEEIDNRPNPETTRKIEGIIAALAVAGGALILAMLLTGCQSISCTADNGARISIEGSNSKPINAGIEAQAGDAALSAAAALAGGGTGAAIAGAPGALAGAGIGYLLNDALQPDADGATCPLPTGTVEIK